MIQIKVPTILTKLRGRHGIFKGLDGASVKLSLEGLDRT